MPVPRKIHDLLDAEYDRALSMYPASSSPQTALGPITEQYYDLVLQVMRKEGNANNEALELAIVSVRFLTDLSIWE